MKHLLPSLILLLTISISSKAQEEIFDISKFERPEIDRRALQIGGQLLGENSYLDEAGDESSSTSDFAGTFYAHVQRFRNDESRQFSSRLSLSSRLINSGTSDGGGTSKSFALFPSVRFSRVDRRYFKPGKFYELNVDGFYHYGHSTTTSTSPDSETKQRNSDHFAYAFVPLKTGTGRLEQVQDARHAVLIQEALLSKGRLAMAMDANELDDFAHLISDLKNQRFYDSRLQNIRELEAVDSFLVANGHVNTCDARYFATLSDMWDFGSGPSRMSGQRISFGFEPGVYSQVHRSEFDLNEEAIRNDRETYAVMGAAGVDFVLARPLNIKWQNDFEAHAVLGVSSGRTDSYSRGGQFETFTTPSIRVGLSQGWGFYPSTRTEVRFSYGADYINFLMQEHDSETIASEGGQGVLAKVSLDVNYYISPRTRFNATFDMLGNWSDPSGTQGTFQDPLTVSYYSRNYDSLVPISSDATSIDQALSIRLTHSIY